MASTCTGGLPLALATSARLVAPGAGLLREHRRNAVQRRGQQGLRRLLAGRAFRGPRRLPEQQSEQQHAQADQHPTARAVKAR